MDFRHVIPLGARCRLTHNLRLHFGGEGKFPFDWFILPLPGLLTCLEEGLDAARIYDPGRLTALRDAKGMLHSVRNTRLGILHHHDFPRGEGDSLLPGWQEQIPKAAARFAHLAGRLRAAAAEGPVLYVREHHKHDDPAALARLQAMLRNLAPGAGFRLLAVNYEPGAVPAGIEAITVQEEGEGRGWRGDPQAWGAALASTGHRLLPR
ncbi:MAG TPA: DUF1796 family putative cysteine peptidase [Roseomonas sp.]|jgi:hypothetical protein